MSPLPLPASINELKERITSALDNVTGDMLQHVWHILSTNEIGHRVNLRCSTPKLLYFIELDKIVFKIIALKITSKFLGHPVFLCIYIYTIRKESVRIKGYSYRFIEFIL